MSDWKFLNRYRLTGSPMPSSPSDGFNGEFIFPIAGEARSVHCIASDGFGWQHVSVSFGISTATPSWDLMCKVKDLFWEEEDVVVQFHPKKSEYVNIHQGCLRMWRCTDGREHPTPPHWMVGPKR